MASLTVRDIPDSLFEKIRILSSRDRRSINKEILIIMEDGLRAKMTAADASPCGGISPELQLTLWRDMAGKWKDERSTDQIVADIRNSRTTGREVHL